MCVSSNGKDPCETFRLGGAIGKQRVSTRSGCGRGQEGDIAAVQVISSSRGEDEAMRKGLKGGGGLIEKLAGPKEMLLPRSRGAM